MSFAIDASVVAAWLFNEEQQREADALVQRGFVEGLIAPTLMQLEIANTLRTRVRRRLIDVDTKNDVFGEFRALPIEWDSEFDVAQVVALSDRYELTAYDAAYLELALRRRTALATFDEELRFAAERAGVSAP